MKRSWFYPRLAWRSIRKNRALYLPYFLMGALMVAVYYMMVYLCTPQVLSAMGAGEAVHTMLGLGLGVVGVFSAVFLYYCSTFLIRRRMKEYGLYNVLGMGKGNIACIMLFETLITLALTLALGLTAGVSLARAVELIMIRIMKAELATGLFIRWDGIVRAVQGFGVIHLIILFISLLRMRLSNPIALLRAESAGEKPPRANWLVALAGLLLLGAGYGLAVMVKSASEAMYLFFFAALLVIAGTYLLFIAGSVTLCRLLQKNKSYYYQPHHFISLSAMTYRMKRNGAGLATICILCTMVLVMLSSSLCLYSGIEDTLDTLYPRKVAVQTHVEAPADFTEEHRQELITGVLAQAEASDLLRMDGMSAMGFLTDDAVLTAAEGRNAASAVTQFFIYPLSLYEAVTGEKVPLNAGELLYAPLRSRFSADSLSFFGSHPYAMRRLDHLPDVFEAPCNLTTLNGIILFAGDFDDFCAELIRRGDAQPVSMTRDLCLYFNTPLTGEALDRTMEQLRISLRQTGSLLPPETSFSFRVQTEQASRGDLYGMFGSLFFLGLVLGAVFSLSAALIIYYKQISEGYEDAGRFAVMRRVGLTDEQIHRSVNSQVLTVFFAPLLMAGVHVLFAMPVIQLLLSAFGMTNAPLYYLVTGICLGVFALVYAAVYWATSRTYYRIVK